MEGSLALLEGKRQTEFSVQIENAEIDP